jgi:hypothetical protein
VIVPAAFFVASGLLDGALSLFASGQPIGLGMLWTVTGRSLMNVVVGCGLWRRIALCRSIALVYCLAAVITYGFALVFAYTQEPLHFSTALVVGSAFEVPSCVLLFGYLRSPEAAALFVRSVFQ